MRYNNRVYAVTAVYVLLATIVGTSGTAAPFVTATSRHRQGLVSGPVISSHGGLSLGQCLLMCARQPQCRAFNYGLQDSAGTGDDDNQCQLLDFTLCNSSVPRQLQQHDTLRYYDVYENSVAAKVEAARMLSLTICTQQGRCKFPDCLQQLGEPCSSVQECVDPLNFRCINGVCSCLVEYIEENGNCYPPSQLGSSCQIGRQCTAADANTICDAGTCMCSAGFWNRDNIECLPVRQLGESCSSVQECSDPLNFLCTSGVCSCQANHVAVSSQCHSIVQPGGACQLTEQCQGASANSLCQSGTCICKPGFWNSANTECLPVRQLGESCSDVQECADPVNFLCTSGVCSCPSGLVAAGGQCYPTVQLGGACQVTEQCQYAFAACSSSTCKCQSGYWNRDNIECRKAMAKGGSCTYQQDCTSLSSRHECANGVCRERVGQEHSHGIYGYRLASGAHVKQGRVELRKNGGAWGVVCDDVWDNNDAAVVCRSLGYNSGGTAHLQSQFGAGSVQFYLDNVQCSGSESHLAACSANSWGAHNCGSGEVAAVTCN